MLYGGETWALTKRLESVLVGCDHRMLRYMAGVTRQDRVTSEEVVVVAFGTDCRSTSSKMPTRGFWCTFIHNIQRKREDRIGWSRSLGTTISTTTTTYHHHYPPNSCGVGMLGAALLRRRLGWFGHVERMDKRDVLGRVWLVEAPSHRPPGRPKKIWRS